jgi:hypothetical protein
MGIVVMCTYHKLSSFVAALDHALLGEEDLFHGDLHAVE